MPLCTTLFLVLTLLAAPLAAEARLDKVPSSLVYPDFWHTPLGVHRGSPTLLKVLLGDKAHFDDPAGVACTHLDENGESSPQITAFGVNRAAGQVVYNPDMKSLQVLGSKGNGDGHFYLPQGIACLPDGRVAVADTGNHRVVFLKFAHGELKWDHSLGTRGPGPAQFEAPGGVALDSQGRLFVADTGNNRVQIFDAQDHYLATFGSDQEANNAMLRPEAIAVVDPLEPYAQDPQSMLYVVDMLRARVQKFSLDGSFLGQATAPDLGRTNAVFDSLALDYFNNLWVTDREASQVYKLDKNLQFIDSWGRPGLEDGRLNEPRGIAIYRHYGQVLLLEKDSAQYLWIGTDVKDIRFSRIEDPDHGAKLRIDYRLTERAWLDSWVESLDQQKLATLGKHRLQKEGAHTFIWNGDTDGGFRIEPGTYYLVFQVEATYSSATYVKREMRKRFVVK